MYVFQGNNISVGNSKPATMSGTTKSLEIVNMSHLQCQVVGDTNGVITTLPPFASTIKLVNPGQEVTFNLQTPVITANQQTGEYLEINESPFPQVTGITPIALIPVYTTQVQGSMNVTGTTDVHITDTSVPVDITSGNVSITGNPNVTVSNQNINTIVGNPQNNPIPTITQSYYGTGADGAFSPTANYSFNNTVNQADIKNFTSVNIPLGVIVNWLNSAHYVCWYVQGDVNIAGEIDTANATTNVSSSQPKITLFKGSIVIPLGGNGGNGGNGAGYNGYNNVNAGQGGTGGQASPYGAGSGGGGGGGDEDASVAVAAGGGGAGAGYGANGGTGAFNTINNGGNGTNGSATSTGGTAYGNANAGQNATQTGGATLIIVASGNITVSGSIIAKGGNGGNGGNATGTGSVGGGGGGAAGGGSVTLYSGGAVNITGTINVNGGTGGVGGTGVAASGQTGVNGQNGQNGQGGTVSIYQYNDQIAG